MGISCFQQNHILALAMKAFIVLSIILAGARAAPSASLSSPIVGRALSARVQSDPVISTAIRSSPIISTPVVSTPVISRPVISTPVISRPVISAPVITKQISAPVYESQPLPYNYAYAVSDDYAGTNFQASESSDGAGNKEGSYSVALPDGRIQNVNYHANDYDGFVADVTYDGVAQVASAPVVASAPIISQSAPVISKPAPIISRPAPVITRTAPIIKSAPVVTRTSPIITQSAPIISRTAPVITRTAPIIKSAPVISTPVISAPVISRPAISAPIIKSAPVISRASPINFYG